MELDGKQRNKWKFGSKLCILSSNNWIEDAIRSAFADEIEKFSSI